MLTPKEQRRLKDYEDYLARPKWKFIFSYGLTWGVLVFILDTLINYFFDKRSFHWDYHLLISFLIMIPIGIAFGWIVRWLITRYYKKLKEKNN